MGLHLHFIYYKQPTSWPYGCLQYGVEYRFSELDDKEELRATTGREKLLTALAATK